ncbi:MAG: radical SAM protein [Erythrobacter sp.]|nr:radical SAM protein [Erythrobacter sp.]
MPDPVLHTLHFNVTNTCNLSCSFCYINAVKEKTSDLSIPQVRKLAGEAAAVGAKRVIISGGEVFVRKDWHELLEAFAGHGMALSIVSNGTLISPDRIARLTQFPDCNILISLDGDRENHDKIRGREGAHAETIAEITQLREAGIDVQVNATIIKTNFSDVPFLARLSRDLDVPMRLSLLNPYNGRGPNEAPLALDVEEILRLREFCHLLRQEGSRIFLNIPPLLLHAEDVLPIRSPSCGWTKSYCGVTYDGNVTICGVAGADESLYVGNVTETPFDELWRSAPLFQKLRSMDHDDLTGICGRCPVKVECGGACRLSAYKSKDDFAASYGMCQTFYDLGYIPEEVLDPIEMAPVPVEAEPAE